MAQVIVWLFVGLATGCQRADPLEVRVQAETPYEFYGWQERVLERQPESVVLEFKQSVARIVALSPAKMQLGDARMMHSKFHPICRELDGKTVRAVIVAGYAAANEELLRGMILDSDSLVWLLKQPEGVDGTAIERGKVARAVDRRSMILGTAKAQVEANRRRIEELKRSAAKGEADFFVRFARWRVLTLMLP